jgi:NADH-quinone oxidoreductase subunit M
MTASTGHCCHAVRREAPWIERFNVNYHLGVDGISVWFVPLTAFITSSW